MATTNDAYLLRSLELIKADKDSISEIFHENSKLWRLIAPESAAMEFSEDPWMKASVGAMRTPFKTYSGVPHFDLPKSFPKNTVSFDEAVLSRRSIRSYSAKPLDLPQLAKLLFFAYGITGTYQDDLGEIYFRATPSGGALYPIEMYPVVHHVTGLESGLYHFNVRDNQIELLRSGDMRQELSRIACNFEMAEEAPLVIILTAIFRRSTFKYGERGYRWALIEAGHVAQNICTTSVSLGLGSCCIGGFYDDELTRF